MGYDYADLERDFKKNIKNSEEVKDLSRKFRAIRDSFIKESTEQANDFLNYVASLPVDKQIDLLISIYELIFNKEEK